MILERCRGHPFVTQLYSSFETKEYLVFAMEYCHGGELFNLLRRVRRMEEEQAKFYFLETLAALQHLHSQKILYRDLKPENIIIDWEGHLRLADYGLSKIMEQGRTHSFCGSAEYMAPEMLLKYDTVYVEKDTRLRLTTTASEHYSTNWSQDCLLTTPDTRRNSSITSSTCHLSSPNNPNSPRTSEKS